MDTLVKSMQPDTARQAFTDVAGAAYTGALHTVLWILFAMFAMFAIAVPVVALLLRDRRRPAMESSVGDPSMPQPNAEAQQAPVSALS
ncbi:hypothetical protein [Saccharopolyspora elongata]|uniref:Uncharacterized protein n=1 Tax=Saccharopolyspora elongata TaxID=2530387 RepID=A0A4R4Y8K8_9PSEU|nr:hypothetical protein [Saccharopolyspora elongata]TDD40693.1 hypothetical protein E1288_35095 [Saccharopolyspora elongata]